MRGPRRACARRLKAQGPKYPSAGKYAAKYKSYWDARIAQLEAEAEAGALESRAPLTYDDYAKFRGKFDRGMAFQGAAGKRLWELVGVKAKAGETPVLDLSNKVVEDEVGMLTPKAKETFEAKQAARKLDKNQPAPGVPRADHVLIDVDAVPGLKGKAPSPPPEGKVIDIEVISDKSRNPVDYGFTQNDTAFREQVAADAQEALDKYSGDVGIRSSKFGGVLDGRTARVKRVYLLYDATYLDAAAREAIVEEAAVFKNVEIIFSDQVGIQPLPR